MIYDFDLNKTLSDQLQHCVYVTELHSYGDRNGRRSGSAFQHG